MRAEGVVGAYQTGASLRNNYRRWVAEFDKVEPNREIMSALSGGGWTIDTAICVFAGWAPSMSISLIVIFAILLQLDGVVPRCRHKLRAIVRESHSGDYARVALWRLY
jgi:hypothetical protein